MAAIENSSGNKNDHSKKGFVKKSTRVDLTPMVDLGFLLITFFVFTTTMARPTAMKIDMPNDKTTVTDPICNSCVLTAVLCINDQIRYYEGELGKSSLLTADYNSIRQIILAKKKKVALARGNEDQFVLIIKPTETSSFKNFVDITDEVTINNVKRYYIDDLTDDERKLLKL
jgi:biopolymer transport protein ExbD